MAHKAKVRKKAKVHVCKDANENVRMSMANEKKKTDYLIKKYAELKAKQLMAYGGSSTPFVSPNKTTDGYDKGEE